MGLQTSTPGMGTRFSDCQQLQNFLPKTEGAKKARLVQTAPFMLLVFLLTQFRKTGTTNGLERLKFEFIQNF